MISFIYQMLEWIRYDQPHAFVVFFVYVWLVWLAKVLAARRYAPAENDFRTSVSVIIPVFKEDPEVFTRVLQSISDNEPDEILVVVDGGDPAMAEIARGYANRVWQIPKAGKRTALATAIPEAHGEVVFIVDSDTIFTETTIENALKPFADPTVGGVTTQQRIFNPYQNFVRHCCDWMEDLRCTISTPAQSSIGTVGCLSGRTIALRRSILLEVLDEFLADSFLGLKCEIGDARCLTNLTLMRGHRTVYQANSLVFTDCPNTWTRFALQQLRWARSSQRETLENLNWLIRKPFLAFCFVTDILTPFLLVGLVLKLTYHIITGQVETLIIAGTMLENPLVLLLSAYVGAIISIGIRQIPHFRNYLRDVLRLPLFVLALTLVLVPVRIAGFLTMGEQNWITRLVESQKRQLCQPVPKRYAP